MVGIFVDLAENVLNYESGVKILSCCCFVFDVRHLYSSDWPWFCVIVTTSFSAFEHQEVYSCVSLYNFLHGSRGISTSDARKDWYVADWFKLTYCILQIVFMVRSVLLFWFIVLYDNVTLHASRASAQACCLPPSLTCFLDRSPITYFFHHSACSPGMQNELICRKRYSLGLEPIYLSLFSRSIVQHSGDIHTSVGGSTEIA